MAGIDDPGRRSAAAWPQAVGLDLSRPGIARVHDYLLAGKDHLAPDRRLGDRLIAAGPAALRAREDRMFLGRAVRYLVTEAGVRQFLDLGAGYPVAGRGNVHEIAQALVPESRVAYIDNDPLVLAHLRALMTSAPEGQVACLPWDMRYDDLLSDLTMQRTLDYTEPIAVLLVGVLPFIHDEHKPAVTIQDFVDLLPPGSYVVASHLTMEHDPLAAAALAEAYREAGIPVQLRDSGDFGRLAFPGLELVPPGVVLVSQWRAEGGTPLPSAQEVSCYGGVARKPRSLERAPKS